MSAVEGIRLVREFLFPGRHTGTAVPPLDGGLTPNDALEQQPELAEVAEPEDVLPSTSGLYVTSGNNLFLLQGRQRRLVAELGGDAGPLAAAQDGRILVGVAGIGIVAVTTDGQVEPLVTEVAGDPLRCPTAMAVAADGTVYVTDGSIRHHGQDWVRDLMERNRLGRLVRHDPRTGATTVLADGLAYPSGVTLAPEADSLLVCEAWAHRLSRFALSDPARPTVLRENFPGYPGRISPAANGGYWLAVFALRTQLVEFVLTQRDYVDEMMRTIEPDYWIRPALRGLNSGLEPLQGGQIRKLGVVKPWAPPRSYGLVVRLDECAQPVSSLHSRGGGARHGVTSVRESEGRLLVAVRGGDRVLEVPA
ncbi:SMP-30/gluconolactonase/LRE family protein [Prauserella muralis]|uniref:SMP-30/gluconolactonase/LRE family protein n=1 Tax=Prauserella muralis TaxID=588067 RepID=UPI000DD3F5D1|nr:SMP-30/gluconolactonase/LRE family protein [Prauserella muralis]TWE22366.1 strictosidine synthase [Prauserella muralis]